MTVNAGDLDYRLRRLQWQKDFVLTISDAEVAGDRFTTTMTAQGAKRSSAEWIVEAPSSNYGILPLANFGTVTFTNAYATIGGTTGAIDNWQAYAINIATRSQVADTTSALTDSAGTGLPTGASGTYSGQVSSFTVARQHTHDGYSSACPHSAARTPSRLGLGLGMGLGMGPARCGLASCRRPRRRFVAVGLAERPRRQGSAFCLARYVLQSVRVEGVAAVVQNSGGLPSFRRIGTNWPA